MTGCPKTVILPNLTQHHRWNFLFHLMIYYSLYFTNKKTRSFYLYISYQILLSRARELGRSQFLCRLENFVVKDANDQLINSPPFCNENYQPTGVLRPCIIRFMLALVPLTLLKFQGNLLQREKKRANDLGVFLSLSHFPI